MKAISITYSECVFVALGIQHAKHMRRIIFSPVACLGLPHFPTSSHKRHDFRGKELLSSMKYVSISLQRSYKTFVILKNSARYQKGT